MAKHRRFSDKPNDDPIQNDEKTDMQEQEVSLEENSRGLKSILLGLSGGIVIFLGIKYQKFTTIMVCGGLGMMFGSLIFIYEVMGKSLF